MNRFKTMRDIPTQQTRMLRTAGFSRAHAINQFALLEHEKMRLERELKVWNERCTVTEKRLAQVHDKLRMISELLLAPEDAMAARDPLDIETALAAEGSRGHPPATVTPAPAPTPAELPAPPAPQAAARPAPPPDDEPPPKARPAPAKPAPAAEPPPHRGLILEY